MLIACDTETSGLDYTRERIIGLAVAQKNKKGVYKLWDQVDKDKVREMLAKHENSWHNFKFDGHMLKRAGFEHPKFHHDTMVMAQLLGDGKKNDLESVASRWLGMEPWKHELQNWLKDNGLQPGDYHKVPLDIVMPYAVKDVEAGLGCAVAGLSRIKDAGFEGVYRAECELTKVLIDMEDYGHAVDNAVFKDLYDRFKKEMRSLERKAAKIAGTKFDMDSDEELDDVLFKRLGLQPVEFGKDGKPKKDKYVLDNLDHPICDVIKSWRTAAVMYRTFCRPVVEDGRGGDGVMRGNFKQLGTRTGRLSCEDPNLQNIPKKHDIRSAFVTRPGKVNLYFDYSNMEMMVYAHFSNDPFLKRVFAEGRDAHTEMAKEFYRKTDITDDERKNTKTLNFLIIYGGGMRALTRKFKVTREEARQTINRYYQTFPNLRKFAAYIMDKVKTDGGITNPFGRRRRLDPDDSYKGVNTLVQGTCGDVMKRAMVALAPDIRNSSAKPLLTIHDELVIECDPKDAAETVAIVKKRMEDFPQFTVPLKAEVKWTDTNWKEKRPLEEAPWTRK